MNLKLAEYNLKNGKFDRFLELGSNIFHRRFGYYGNEIRLSIYRQKQGWIETYFYKDKTDPLNRFDGRTYGNGRFVLIVDDQDDLYQVTLNFCTPNKPLTKEIKILPKNRIPRYAEKKLIGNLHQSPELLRS